MKRLGWGIAVLALMMVPVGSGGESLPGSGDVRTGTLYVRGWRIEPPYLFSLDGDTLRVSGVPVLPVRGVGHAVEVGENARRRHQLLEECVGRVSRFLDEGGEQEEARDVVIAFLGESPLVTSAARYGRGSVRVQWRSGSPAREYVVVPAERGPAPVSRVEMLERRAEMYRRYLERGDIVIVSAGGEMILRAERRAALRRDLALLEQAGDPENRDFEVLSADFAREFLARMQER